MIYPLEHTNIGLSGQVKIDIFIRQENNCLFAYDLKVSPVSENIPFVYDDSERDIKKSHSYNIMKLKSTLGKLFYATQTNLNTEFFVPESTESCPIKTNDTQYEAGLRRASFKKYGKQMQLFVPLWVDGFEKTWDDYAFVFFYAVNSKGAENEVPNYEKAARYNIKFSDEVKYYLNNLYSNMENFDDIFSVDLFKYEAYIYGVDTNDGVEKKKDISNLVINLRDRERPLIEQNSMISSQFEQNEFICKNLVNLNFVFDPEDVINTMVGPFFGENIHCKIEIAEKDSIMKDGENYNFFKHKDFFFNHFEIPSQVINENADIILPEGRNMYDKTNEHLVFDFAWKNRIAPKICHWSNNLLEPSFFNLSSDFALEDINGVKGRTVPDATDFTCMEKKNSNNIFNIIRKSPWVTYNGAEISLSLFFQKAVLDISNLNDYNNISLDVNQYVNISEDYVAGSNKIPGIKVNDGRNYYIQFVIYNKEDLIKSYLTITPQNNNTMNYYCNIVVTLDDLRNINSVKDLNEFLQTVDTTTYTTHVNSNFISNFGSYMNNWLDEIRNNVKYRTIEFNKGTVAKLHKDKYETLVSYDLYKIDKNYHSIIYRLDGKIYPYLIDVKPLDEDSETHVIDKTDKYFNKFYEYKTLPLTSSKDMLYVRNRVKPNYVKGDVYFALKSYTREEWLKLNPKNRPMLNTGLASLAYLPHKFPINEDAYIVDFENGYSETNRIDPYKYLKEVGGPILGSVDDLNKERYDFIITDIEEKLKDGIIIYRYKIKYELR